MITLLTMNLGYVVLSYNHPNLTARTLQSLIKQGLSNKTLLVHNGSREEVVESLQQQFPEIQHLVIPENRGFSGGANAGLKSAFKLYPWVFFLTNDCVYIEGASLPTQSGLYAPLIFRRKISMVDSLGGTVNLLKAQLRHLRESDYKLKTHIYFYVPGTAFLIHKDVFNETGGFDETLGTYWEDVDLSLRLKATRFKMSALPNWQVLHSVGKTCHKDSYYTIFLFNRNRIRVSRKFLEFRKNPCSRLVLESHLLKDMVVRTFYFAKRARWADIKLYIKSYWSAY